MTKSSKGTIENPGKNVKQKSGLNRVILDSRWGKLDRFLQERAVVHKIDPKHTSQKCSSCGHVSKDSRKTQSKFKCMSCELEMNADFNASLNILASGMETIKNGRLEYFVPLLKDQVVQRQSNTESAFPSGNRRFPQGPTGHLSM